MPETETAQERNAKAIELAYERGKRDQEVDSRLDAGERRFALINGSMERSAKAQESLKRELTVLKEDVKRDLDALRDAIRKLDAKVEISEAVSEALAKAARSHWERWVSLAAIVVVLVGAILDRVL